MEDGTRIEDSNPQDEEPANTDANGNTSAKLLSPNMNIDTSPPQSPPSPTSQRLSAPGTHKRNFSGGILSRLNFLRTSSDSERSNSHERPKSREKGVVSPASPPKPRTSTDEPPSPPSPSNQGENAMAAALKQQKTRKRKGSLRKTALLGGRMGRERKGSFSLRSPIKVNPQPMLTETAPTPITFSGEGFSSSPYAIQGTEQATNRVSEFDAYREANIASNNPGSVSRDEADDNAATARLSLLTDTRVQQLGEDNFTLTSPLDEKSPVSQTSQTSYISTTDEDELLTFDRPTTNSHLLSPPLLVPKPLSVNATSYFPSELPRKRSSKRSPLSHATPVTASAYSPVPEPHDYIETSYWGWVILIVTWITFTVGMGSSLGVWSWAWDVGETPYAPPELEDDPTLPIVGYYPALIVLTGVVAWVWVAVAWVGMKYFRHAKIEV